jgi:hypothetical protein
VDACGLHSGRVSNKGTRRTEAGVANPALLLSVTSFSSPVIIVFLAIMADI